MLIPPSPPPARHSAPFASDVVTYTDFTIASMPRGPDGEQTAGKKVKTDGVRTLTWREKTATRIPEATWMSFHPKTSTTKSSSAVNWTFDVLGHPIDPLDVPKGGTRFKHAVWDGATLHDSGAKKEKSLRLRTLDSAILAPGDTAHLLKFCHGTISPGPANDTERCGDDVDPVRGGVHANVHNNLWGTAFPQWYDDDASFRFQLLQE